MNKTQELTIKEHLERGLTITPLEAWTKYGIYHLATPVKYLRRKGMNIKTTMREFGHGADKKKYGEYSLVVDKPVIGQFFRELQTFFL